MKRFSVLLLIFFQLASCDCIQHTSGIVLDKETKTALGQVTIGKYIQEDPNNSFSRQIFTDSLGHFEYQAISGGFFGCPPLKLYFSKEGYKQIKAKEMYFNDTIYLEKRLEQTDYYFGPSVSVLEGILKVEMYYGAPNYGENPESDTKEYSYIFYPDNKINVIQNEENSDFDITTKEILKFQLAPLDEINLHPYINKRIRVTGEFYGRQTGHHHTDVLLALTKVEKI